MRLCLQSQSLRTAISGTSTNGFRSRVANYSFNTHMENGKQRGEKEPQEEKPTRHRLPEPLRQTVAFSFRLTRKNAEKLRELMNDYNTNNLRLFIEKTVLKLERDSVVETRQRFVSNSFSNDYFRQFKGVATNLNQLVATVNTLAKKDRMSASTSQDLAERARRIMDTLEVFLNEKGAEQ